MQELSLYEVWLGDVLVAISNRLICTASEAEILTEAQKHALAEAWDQGLAAIEAAMRVIKVRAR